MPLHHQLVLCALLYALQDHSQALPFYKRIAAHYESTGNLEEAERYYIKAGMAMAAVDMYGRANKCVSNVSNWSG